MQARRISQRPEYRQNNLSYPTSPVFPTPSWPITAILMFRRLTWALSPSLRLSFMACLLAGSFSDESGWEITTVCYYVWLILAQLIMSIVPGSHDLGQWIPYMTLWISEEIKSVYDAWFKPNEWKNGKYRLWRNEKDIQKAIFKQTPSFKGLVIVGFFKLTFIENKFFFIETTC